MQCADFAFKCLNKTAPRAFYNLFEKVNHRKATRFNGCNLNIPKIKTESAERGLFFVGVKIFNTLPMHLKKEIIFFV